MALSKKHYEQFAYNIRQQLETLHETMRDKDPRAFMLKALATKMAVDFALDNPRFDRARFLAACGF